MGNIALGVSCHPLTFTLHLRGQCVASLCHEPPAYSSCSSPIWRLLFLIWWTARTPHADPATAPVYNWGGLNQDTLITLLQGSKNATQVNIFQPNRCSVLLSPTSPSRHPFKGSAQRRRGRETGALPLIGCVPEEAGLGIAKQQTTTNH